jgi:hypothetical protein
VASVPFRFLSHAEFFALSQDDKAGYLVAAVKELGKLTELLGKPDRPEVAAPAARSSSKPRTPG